MSALLSADGVYRYSLTRTLPGGSAAVLWIMLNPSTADASVDDPTIRRVCSFSRRLGAGTVTVVNLFALRATDPAELGMHPDPTGPLNKETVTAAIASHSIVVCAWGSRGSLYDRDLAVLELLRRAHKTPYVLGLTSAGRRPQPLHPLYLRKDTVFRPWRT